MTFLKPDDYIILMDWNDTPQTLASVEIPSRALSLDELKEAKDLGLNTVIVQVYWNNVEPSMGNAEWEFADALIEKYIAADLRAILVTPVFVPPDAPDDYYFKYEDGALEKAAFSIWNQEAMELQRKFLEKMIERYTSPDVQIILGELQGGEFLLPIRAGFYDTSALTQFGGRPDPNVKDPRTVEWLKESVVNHYLYMQEPLAEQHGEVWDAMHQYIAYWHHTTGDQFQTDIHAAYHNKWPEVDVILLQYTFMYHASNAIYMNHVYNLRDMGAKVIIEADYTTGLKDSTPLAISEGFSGQICCPFHPWAPGGTSDYLRPEQIEALSKSIGLWRKGA